MGLGDVLIRFSIWLYKDIQRTYEQMKDCMAQLGILETKTVVHK